VREWLRFDSLTPNELLELAFVDDKIQNDDVVVFLYLLCHCNQCNHRTARQSSSRSIVRSKG
jgi:hypothetical protein